MVLKTKVKQVKMTEKEKREQEAEEKALKERESKTAFRGWYVCTGFNVCMNNTITPHRISVQCLFV